MKIELNNNKVYYNNNHVDIESIDDDVRYVEGSHMMNRKSEKKQDVVVTCFTMVRQFRAWKGYYQKSKLPLNVEAEYNLRAAAHFKRSLFLAWWQLCLEAEAEQKQSLKEELLAAMES